MQHRSFRLTLIGLLLVGLGADLSACAPAALGPLGSGDGLQYADVHSHDCSGLAVERQARTERISALEKAVQSELGAPPTTLMQVMQRGGSSPEVGTNAYTELVAERHRLEETTAFVESAKCPVDAVKSPH